MQQYHKGVIIGRFQPFHLGHMHLIENAFTHCEELIIVVGSMLRARSARNPFNFEQRRKLILANLHAYDSNHGTHYANRVKIEGVRDYLYFEDNWLADVAEAVDRHLDGADKVALIGHDKDKTTYYLKHFPQWSYVEVPNFKALDASDVRKAWFAGNDETLSKVLMPPSLDFLETFKQKPEFLVLQEENAFIERYKASWSVAPYRPIFVTTDSIVLCENHILLIQRGHNPGKGLWALPGGFVEPDEWIEKGLIRELQEETCIELNEDKLKSGLVTIRVFDHPQRSQIGRVITHAGLFQLEGPMPKVKAADDAKQVTWWPLSKLSEMENKMHDDHYQVVQFFIRTVL